MSTKEAKKAAKKVAKMDKHQEKLQKKQAKMQKAGRFKRWRNRRPFWGASLTTLAALLILYIPLQLYAIAFIPGSLVFVGFLFGGLLLIIGVLTYIYPQFSTVFGVITIFLSVLSIMGALGGFIVGTILGIVGGALCVGWRTEIVAYDNKQSGRKKNKKTAIKNDEGTTTATL